MKDELLQERLTRLENGEPLETCLAGLPEAEANLVRLAAILRATPAVTRQASRVAAQRQALLTSAKEKLSMTSPTPKPTLNRQWLLPAGAVSAVIGMVIIALVVSATFGRFSQQSSNDLVAQPTTVFTGKNAEQVGVQHPATSAQNAALNQVRGIVEVQDKDGAWHAAKEGQLLIAGQHVRTGVLSSVTLAFYDGSQAHVGASSELALDTLNAEPKGLRTVQLTQLIGTSTHHVATSADANSVYDVTTPAGKSSAKGTVFEVAVTLDQQTRVDVDEGLVVVVGLDKSVDVVAGQSTVIIIGQPPQDPVFRMTGEGLVEQTGAGWRIAGRAFATSATTLIVGNPQVGDWVTFKARILSNGTRLLDSVVLLHHDDTDSFSFVGEVEVIGATDWVVSGRVIRLGAGVAIDADLVVGDWVKVEGTLGGDGSLTAIQIIWVPMDDDDDDDGLPFSFVGVVGAIGDAAWTIAGIEVAVDDDTNIQDGIAVGDIVLAAGRIDDDNTWHASTILLAQANQREFTLVGTVDSMDPWIVAGMDLETSEDTNIDEGIAVGDRVRAEGFINDAGAWVALEIMLLEEETGHFEFVGTVVSIDPWVVAGTSFSVTAETEIEAGIEVGDLVRVEGNILADGTWVATEISEIEPVIGCLGLSAIVQSVSTGHIVLLDSQTVSLDGVEIEGEMLQASVVFLYGCVGRDGRLIIIYIIVIYQLDELPIIIIIDDGNGGPCVDGPDKNNGKGNDCNKPKHDNDDDD